MSELLPGVQAPVIQESLLDYLSTTFSLADEEAGNALSDFLSNKENGIFKGPYLRVRLPYKSAEEGWRSSLEWYEGFTPYGHQAKAFERLSSFNLSESKPRPLPTLVTTGTGSGKTEAFLYPIIDHVLRARRNGVAGMKALILYPMNALANDQAQRLASLLTEHDELSGITAALYTGEQGTNRSKVSSESLITNRKTIRNEPPDILLTNYKMLDQLLLRHEDASLWAKSATSLQYLVLDEFHTYDGAQGTDVTMLLRRLGLALKSNWPDGMMSEADRSRPLGQVTPVATSATLGDKGDPSAMLGFASTVFGEEFNKEAVITESRVVVGEWAHEDAELRPRTDRQAIEGIVESVRGQADGRRIAEIVFNGLFQDEQEKPVVSSATSTDELLVLAKNHPFTVKLAEVAEQSRLVDSLAEELLPSIAVDEHGRHLASQFLLAFSAALSHVRKVAGRESLSVDLHLWIRELSRIDRLATGSPKYLWSDDQHLRGVDDETYSLGVSSFPAVYCRHCGRSGWAVVRAPVGAFTLAGSDANDIRKARFAESNEFRALIHAPGEAEQDTSDAETLALDPDEPKLLWFRTTERYLDPTRPSDGEDLATGKVLPVLAHSGPKAGDFSRNDTCPSCMQKDGIRFLGSAVATLLSVGLSTIFGSSELGKAEKKALIFTDSVQDAAHRAGFVQSRSHSLTLRTVFRNAVAGGPASLDSLVDQAMLLAGDDSHLRYRLIPPDFADRKEFEPFWQRTTQSDVPVRVRNRVKRRLLLDAALEFGMQARLGRTLELTGSLAVEVDVSPSIMLKIASDVEEVTGVDRFEGMQTTDSEKTAWVRGVLERMRTDGAIGHEWFRTYQRQDGKRYSIWGGRPRTEGMPAFPKGRPAPAYPRIGDATGQESDLVPAGSPRSWYAIWTSKVLKVTPGEGASLVVSLLDGLNKSGVVEAFNTDSSARVYELPQQRIIVTPVEDEEYRAGECLLKCGVCQALVPGTRRVVGELDGQPCFVLRCVGRLKRSKGNPANFYRQFYQASNVTRVVAREHTSLLETEERLKYENEFKSSSQNPDAPNVLVATPTLEMGIDIGDLSSVILASLPKSVASYLQRVGRAGRLTGSSLNLAFVSSRGEQLPRLGDPLSVINGEVRPPATYIDANEILRRQYLASIADQLARDPSAPHPGSATQAIGSVADGSYLAELIECGERSSNVELFIAAMATLSDQSQGDLRAWADPRSGPKSSLLSYGLHDQRTQWTKEIEELKYRISAIQKSLPELQAKVDLPASDDDDKVALRTAKAALGLSKKQLGDLKDAFWVSVLEEYGILPNYTLLDDSVTLDVTMSWIDPETQEFMSEPATFNRAASSALHEFAPGATFYARGFKIAIDAVDLGTNSDIAQKWVFCPSCGFSQDLSQSSRLAECPRCGSQGISDVQQEVDVVELERVSSAMRREEASIDDGRDERERATFQVVTAADVVDPKKQWYLEDYAFGLKYVTNMNVRWVNVGKVAAPSSSSLFLAGNEYSAPLFRVCSGCGKLDSRTGRNSPHEHRPWCKYRNSENESVRQVALSRSLKTEGVVIRLPATIVLGDEFAVPSLMAAFRLGLREHLGGAPDHLELDQIVDPTLSDGSDNQQAVLIHDTVPGGTGYLAELAEPEKLYQILYQAWILLRDCACKEEGRAACDRCLTPFVNSFTQKYVSRLTAERYLAEILRGGQSESDVTSTCGWQVTEDESITPDHETQIEQKFRKVLLDRLQSMGATVHQEPGPDGNVWTINYQGGRTWGLYPQRSLGFVQPDFMLISNDQSIPQLAIFCDGWKFHASPTVNRLADDAIKRQRLRDQGYIVIGVTWQDLVDVEEKKPSVPAWFSESRWQQAMGAFGGKLSPGMLEIVKGGPIDFMARWISNPNSLEIEHLAEAVPLLLVGAGSSGRSNAGKNLVSLAKDCCDGMSLPDAGDRNVWSWQADTLNVMGRNMSDKGFATEIAVVLDDRDDRLGELHKPAWRDWIRLSNLLNLRNQPLHISTYSQETDFDYSQADDGEELSGPWAAIYESVLGGVERDLLFKLAQADLPTPSIGFETRNGLPLEICWPEFKIVVDLDLDDADKVDVIEEGWTLVDAEWEAIAKELKLVGGM